MKNSYSVINSKKRSPHIHDPSLIPSKWYKFTSRKLIRRISAIWHEPKLREQPINMHLTYACSYVMYINVIWLSHVHTYALGKFVLWLLVNFKCPCEEEEVENYKNILQSMKWIIQGCENQLPKVKFLNYLPKYDQIPEGKKWQDLYDFKGTVIFFVNSEICL